VGWWAAAATSAVRTAATDSVLASAGKSASWARGYAIQSAAPIAAPTPRIATARDAAIVLKPLAGADVAPPLRDLVLVRLVVLTQEHGHVAQRDCADAALHA